MLVIDNCEEHLEKVWALTKKLGLQEKLDKKLSYLENYGGENMRCILYPATEPLSFFFRMEGRGKTDEYELVLVGTLAFYSAGGDDPTSTEAGWRVNI
jgi:hypothetical protein